MNQVTVLQMCDAAFGQNDVTQSLGKVFIPALSSEKKMVDTIQVHLPGQLRTLKVTQ